MRIDAERTQKSTAIDGGEGVSLMEIRPCRPGDCQAICDIYNYYIENTVISFEETAVTVAELEERVATCTRDYPWLVCVADGGLVGYAYANKWQQRSAYRLCAETTVYLRSGETGRGYGRALYQALLPLLLERGLHVAIAGIALPNDASVRLHESIGFTKVAHYHGVGWKFGQRVDVGYWQKNLRDG
jgi:phosphinothricin acetyltransferase